MMTPNKNWPFWALSGLVVVLLGLGCGSPGAQKATPTAAVKLPSYALDSGPKVKEAYQFAAQDPQALEYVPCYCGCVNIGHRNNRDCYIEKVGADGSITFTDHAST